MITISDNTATNMLISRLGIDFLNEEFKKIGLEKTHIERLLFDSEASAQGKCNYIVPAEMGMLLEQVYRRTFVSKEVSPATSATRSPLRTRPARMTTLPTTLA